MDTAHFKALIENRRSQILKTDAQANDSSGGVELDQSRVGRLSRMDAMQMHQMDQESARRRKHELKQLDLALARLGSGDFGFCLECDEHINPKRLEIDPATPFCIKCAQMKETK